MRRGKGGRPASKTWTRESPANSCVSPAPLRRTSCSTASSSAPTSAAPAAPRPGQRARALPPRGAPPRAAPAGRAPSSSRGAACGASAAIVSLRRNTDFEAQYPTGCEAQYPTGYEAHHSTGYEAQSPRAAPPPPRAAAAGIPRPPAARTRSARTRGGERERGGQAGARAIGGARVAPAAEDLAYPRRHVSRAAARIHPVTARFHRRRHRSAQPALLVRASERHQRHLRARLAARPARGTRLVRGEGRGVSD